MLPARGAYTSECMTGADYRGVPAVYTAQELSGMWTVLLFTSANGVDYFMKNVFASGAGCTGIFP